MIFEIVMMFCKIKFFSFVSNSVSHVCLAFQEACLTCRGVLLIDNLLRSSSTRLAFRIYVSLFFMEGRLNH